MYFLISYHVLFIVNLSFLLIIKLVICKKIKNINIFRYTIEHIRVAFITIFVYIVLII
jgi:hypothetical protein